MSGADGRRTRSVEVLVVGAGPAGLTTATALGRRGVQVEVVDREAAAGGMPQHCHHTGFGLRDLRRVLSGPDYARRLVDRAEHAGARVRPGVAVTGWAGADFGLGEPAGATWAPVAETTAADGLERVEAAAVVLATGARERPRAARWVPGDRPSRVYTTGHLQQAVELRQIVGTRAVVVGAEHVSFSAALTLHEAGARVVAMTTEHGRHQTYGALRLAARAGLRFPVLDGTVLERVVGRRELDGVVLRDLRNGRTSFVACDALVLTGDWVADAELARTAGAAMSAASTGPVADTRLRTSVRGLVVAGNVAHPVLTADLAAADGEVAAEQAMALLHGRATAAGAAGSVEVVTAEPLRWVFPSRISADRGRPPRGRFVVWAEEPRGHPVVEVRQGGRLLWSGRARTPLAPGRPVGIPASWVGDVALPGQDVVVSVH